MRVYVNKAGTVIWNADWLDAFANSSGKCVNKSKIDERFDSEVQEAKMSVRIAKRNLELNPTSKWYKEVFEKAQLSLESALNNKNNK